MGAYQHFCLLFLFFAPPVHEADVLGAVWSRLAHRGPRARGPDWRAARNQAEIRAHPETGAGADYSLLQCSADAAGAGRHVRWSEPEISRTAGNLNTVLCCLVGVWSDEASSNWIFKPSHLDSLLLDSFVYQLSTSLVQLIIFFEVLSFMQYWWLQDEA